MNDIPERKLLGQGQGYIDLHTLGSVTPQDTNLFTVQEAEIAAVIAEHLVVEPVRVTRQARFIDDLDADSLDAICLTMEIEDRFAIKITDAECDNLWAVQAVFNIVAEKRQ